MSLPNLYATYGWTHLSNKEISVSNYNYRRNQSSLYIDILYGNCEHIWEFLSDRQEFLDSCVIKETHIIPYETLETLEDKYDWRF